MYGLEHGLILDGRSLRSECTYEILLQLSLDPRIHALEAMQPTSCALLACDFATHANFLATQLVPAVHHLIKDRSWMVAAAPHLHYLQQRAHLHLHEPLRVALVGRLHGGGWTRLDGGKRCGRRGWIVQCFRPGNQVSCIVTSSHGGGFITVCDDSVLPKRSK